MVPAYNIQQSYSQLLSLCIWQARACLAPMPGSCFSAVATLLLPHCCCCCCCCLCISPPGIITTPLPLGAVAMLGLGGAMLTKTLTFAEAFSAFATEIP